MSEVKQFQNNPSSDFEDDPGDDFDSGRNTIRNSAPINVVEYVQGHSERTVEDDFDSDVLASSAHRLASVVEGVGEDVYDVAAVTIGAVRSATVGLLGIVGGIFSTISPLLASEDINLRTVNPGRKHNSARVGSSKPQMSEEETQASKLENRFSLAEGEEIDSPVVTGKVRVPRSAAKMFYGCFPTIKADELNRIRASFYRHGAKFNYFTSPHEVKQFSIRFNFAIVDLDDHTIYYNGDTFNPQRAKWILFREGRVCYTNSVNSRSLKKSSITNWRKYVGADFDNFQPSKDPEAWSEGKARELLCPPNGKITMRRSQESSSMVRGVFDKVSSSVDGGLAKIADSATEVVTTSHKLIEAIHRRGNSIFPTNVLQLNARVLNVKVIFKPTTDLSVSELLDLSQAELTLATTEGDQDIRARVTSTATMPKHSRIRGQLHQCNGSRAIFDAFPTVPDLAHNSNIYKHPIFKIFVSAREVHAMSCFVNMVLFDVDDGRMYVNTMTTKLNDFPRTIVHSRGHVWYSDDVSMSGMVVTDIRDFSKPLGPQKNRAKL